MPAQNLLLKSLCLEIDNVLSGEAGFFIKKFNSRFKFLYRQANYVDKNALLCPYLYLFAYVISFWYGRLSETTRTKLQRAQNKVIRILFWHYFGRYKKINYTIKKISK